MVRSVWSVTRCQYNLVGLGGQTGYWEVKALYALGKGSVSRTVRQPIVRWDMKQI